jgi:hypothetical protein
MIIRFAAWRRRACVGTLLLAGAMAPALHAALHVTLRNGSEFDCTRQETIDGGKVRLYLFPLGPQDTKDDDYIDVAASAVSRVETEPDPVLAVAADASASPKTTVQTALTAAEMQGLGMTSMRICWHRW